MFDYADYFPHSKRAHIGIPQELGAFMDYWFEQLNLKPSTLASYRRIKDGFWKRHLGQMPLSAIKHSDITAALKKGGWPSEKTRNNHLSVLSAIFRLALADDLVAKIPCDSIEGASRQKKQPDPFSPDEVGQIL